MPRKKTVRLPKIEFPDDGQVRAVIEAITPAIDGGRFAAKRVTGDRVEVEADCFTDGHDMLACVVRHRRDDEADWQEAPMALLVNDRWQGSFVVGAPGRYRFTVIAWVDGFLSWRHDFARRVDVEDLRSAAQVGADLIEGAAQRASGEDRAQLRQWAGQLRETKDAAPLRTLALNEPFAAVAMRYPDRSLATTFPVEFPLVVDRERARYSAWYELFPRSFGSVRASTARCATALRSCPTWRGWGSTYSTCRRSIRSAASAARVRTTRSMPPPPTSGVPGRSAPRKAVTPPCTRTWARSTTSARPRRRGA